MKKLIFAIAFSLTSIFYLFPQQMAFGAKLTGLSIHPAGAAHWYLMPWKLDERAIFVINPGARINFEYFIYRDIFSVKIEQGLYKDCLFQLGGFTHLGLRGRIFQIGRHSLNFGIGPTFIYRRSWYQIDGYRGDDAFFRGSPEDEWQWRFLWYGGDFEYNFRIAGNTELSVSLVPFIPILVHFGVRIIINEHR